MIQEIINYMKHLREHSPKIFEEGLEPSKGLHILIEIDDDGNAINFPGEKGKDWDYYDGKEITAFLKSIIPYEQEIQCIITKPPLNKALDKKKQISSCSPFSISIKKGKIVGSTDFTKKEILIELENLKNERNDFSYNKIYNLLQNELEKKEGKKISIAGIYKIILLLRFYFEKGISECLIDENIISKVNNFKRFLINNLEKIIELDEFNKMKKDFFLNIYLKVSIEEYKRAHDNYLMRNLFNKNNFNSEKEIKDDTYGLSGFFNGLNDKKTFLKHKTATMYKGIAYRIKAKDTIYLNDFDILLHRKKFPMPLPIFIDKREFKTTDEMLQIFKEDNKVSYSEMLRKIFERNNKVKLENYYLLFFNYKYELKDFDFVTKFRYFLKDKDDNYLEIKNIYELKENNEIKPNITIKNIFQFESYIVKTIFNNSLVKIDKNNTYSVKYFDEIDPTYVSGGELIYQIILKYRKAFYDYIYKSKIESISSTMWDEIMWNSVIADLKSDKINDKGYHSKEYSIKEKLNIWFSLYNYFINNKGRYNMSSKIPDLLEKMRQIANNETNSKHLESVEEFCFGAGQIIYFLLDQSKASEKTHALLEPFIQKVNAEQLQTAISNLINTYKHELRFGQGRFEKLASEVLAFETNENLKKYQRFLLAGYFAKPVIYAKHNKGGEDE